MNIIGILDLGAKTSIVNVLEEKNVLDFGCGAKPYRKFFKSKQYFGIILSVFANTGCKHKKVIISHPITALTEHLATSRFQKLDWAPGSLVQIGETLMILPPKKYLQLQ